MNVNNRINSAKKLITAIGLISALIFSSSSNAGMEVSNPSRLYQITTIKGVNLPINGQAVDAYSVMAVESGKLIPIPFQFDDLNIKGLTFVPGAIIKVDGRENIIDDKDELSFMYKDMGPKSSPAIFESTQGTIISEFEITEDDTSRYAYLVKGHSARSDKVYAHYDFKTGSIETETYSLRFDPENITLWSDWKIKGFKSTENETNILDAMKARFFVRLGFIKATLHNAVIPASTIAVKNGPIRAIVEAEISIGALGMNLLTGGVSSSLSPGSIRFPIFAYFPKAVGTLSELLIDVTVDHINFEGARFSTPINPGQPLIAGEKYSDKIRKQYQSNLEQPWVSVSTPSNWDTYFLSRFSEGFSPTVSALYLDEGTNDKANKPENVKGSSAEFGIRLADIPAGQDALFEHNLYFGKNLWQGNDPKKAAHDFMNPPKVTINNF